MSANKKLVRTQFRHAVFQRDGYLCRCCAKPGKDRQGDNLHQKFHKDPNPVDLDAHHICDRHLMPFGGYVKENGVSLCDECHFKAEAHWNKLTVAEPEFCPEKLYELIGSSLEEAELASMELDES